MGHWIHDALILRWGELTSKMSDGKIVPSTVIDLLLKYPETERDTNASRDLFNTIDELECVWSGNELNKKFDIDHVIPFSLWRNNDLWNLLPADSKINNSKRDKLPSRNLVMKRKDLIINYWELINNKLPVRFFNEMKNFTGKDPGDNRQLRLFSALAEAVEITALQRGVERWEG